MQDSETTTQLIKNTEKWYADLENSKDLLFGYEKQLVGLFECFLKLPHIDILKELVKHMEKMNPLAFSYMLKMARIKSITNILLLEFESKSPLFTSGCQTVEDVLELYQILIFMVRRIELSRDDSFVFEAVEWIVSNRISCDAVKIICENELILDKMRIYQILVMTYQELGNTEIANRYKKMM